MQEREHKAPAGEQQQRHGSRDTSELGTHGGPGQPGYPGRASEGRSERDKGKSNERGVTPDSPIHSP